MLIRKPGIVALLLCLVCLLGGAIGCGTLDAQFTANATTGSAPLSVWFTDLSMGDINTWEWDFENDGVVDSTDQYVLHVYENPGTYTVKLTVNESGRTDNEVKMSFIKVSPPACQAEFVAEPTECHGTTTVQFTDLSTGDVTGWAWDLNGDGDTDSIEQNPVYTYSQNGLYPVILTVTTANCSDTITKYDYISVSGCST
ncbi:MAG: PKD domain-containing protein [Dehalococcoidia bacterium]|jgi:PKD repeat protein